MLPDILHVPYFARVNDYVGAWAIEPQAGAALLAAAQGMDLRRHMMDEEGQPRPKSQLEVVSAGLNQKVAVIHLTGTLMKATSSMDGGTSTVQARREIRKAANDAEISAILLAIDSPGGTVAGTADLAAEVVSANKRKPTWAFAADLAASAAFWVGSQAEKFFANDRTALIGSIGTLLVVYDQAGAAEKLGIKTLVFGTGPIKGAGTPGAAVTEEQQKYFRGIVEDAQKSFDSGVRKGRGLTEAKLEKVKTGGVWGAEEALNLGLIDGIKGFDQVLAELTGEARRRNRVDSSRATSPTSVSVRSAAVNETTITDTSVVPGVKVTQEIANGALQAALNGVARGPLVAMSAGTTFVSQGREEAAADLERIAGIRRVTAGHESIGAQAIREGWSVEKAELAAMKAGLPNNVRAARAPAVISRSHERDCTSDVLQAAVMLRSGLRLDNPRFNAGRGKLPSWLTADINDSYRNQVMDQAHRFNDLSLVDLCKEAIRLDGRDVPENRHDLIHAAISGGSLTAIFTTSVNAVLLVSYMEATDTTMGWTREVDVADFKAQERPRLELQAGLKKLPRGGSADHGKMSDKLESYKVARYAKQLSIDEQDIIDDSLNAFQTVGPDLGRAAARLRPDLVYAILLSNPTLNGTGRALFNTTDGNLGSSSPLNAANLKASIAAMQNVRENGVNLNLMPTHAIVPTSLKWTIKELINSTMIVIAGTAGSVTERGNVNTLANEGMTYASDARLENGVIDPATETTHVGSATTWFLASNMAPTIEVAYLRGTGRAPRTRSWTQNGEGKYGVGWDVNLDIGAAPMDWRGLRKITG
jgi:signal peptide peptidase SppA